MVIAGSLAATVASQHFGAAVLVAMSSSAWRCTTRASAHSLGLTARTPAAAALAAWLAAVLCTRDSKPSAAAARSGGGCLAANAAASAAPAAGRQNSRS